MMIQKMSRTEGEFWACYILEITHKKTFTSQFFPPHVILSPAPTLWAMSTWQNLDRHEDSVVNFLLQKPRD